MVQIGVLGLGNVGSAVVDLLERDRDGIRRQSGTEVSVKRILVRDLSRPRQGEAAGAHIVPGDAVGDVDDVHVVTAG